MLVIIFCNIFGVIIYWCIAIVLYIQLGSVMISALVVLLFNIIQQYEI